MSCKGLLINLHFTMLITYSCYAHINLYSSLLLLKKGKIYYVNKLKQITKHIYSNQEFSFLTTECPISLVQYSEYTRNKKRARSPKHTVLYFYLINMQKFRISLQSFSSEDCICVCCCFSVSELNLNPYDLTLENNRIRTRQRYPDPQP